LHEVIVIDLLESSLAFFFKRGKQSIIESIVI